MLATQQEHEESHPVGAAQQARLLTGDLGTIAVHALVAQGVGCIVSSWSDRPTPIDAAVDDSRSRLLEPRGVVLRRLRSQAALEAMLAAPTGGVTSEPPRTAVILAGRRGMRPALERLAAQQVAGAVVVFCFDEDAARIEGAIVLDPDPSALGLERAVAGAMAASVRAGRPALILVRERMLGMRGTVRAGALLDPREAATRDAGQRAMLPPVGTAEAIAACGLEHVRSGSSSRSQHGKVIVVVGPLGRAVERALAQLEAAMAPVSRDAERALLEVGIFASPCVGVLPAPNGPAAAMCASAAAVAVVGTRAARHAERLGADLPEAAIDVLAVDAGSARGEQLVAALATWVRSACFADADEDVLAVLAQLEQADTRGRTSRVPRRSEVLHRSVSPVVAAGLALAQGVIGVPSRLDGAYPTYRVDTGVPLTVVPAAIFAEHGLGSAAPGAGIGVFLVTGAAADVSSVAGAAGASIEAVDGTSPRAIGVAVARACRSLRAAPHVIVVSELQRVAAPSRARFGMDPDLVGADRIAVGMVPTAAAALVDLGDDLQAGPVVVALDHPATRAQLQSLRELTSATWDLEPPAQAPARWVRSAWGMRRRLVRAFTGVDL